MKEDVLVELEHNDQFPWHVRNMNKSLEAIAQIAARAVDELHSLRKENAELKHTLSVVYSEFYASLPAPTYTEISTRISAKLNKKLGGKKKEAKK